LAASAAEPVKIWTPGLERPGELSAARELLAQGELARADRFVRPQDRARFAIGRAALRRALARELGRDPSALRFRYGPNGRPALAEGISEHGAPLSFNVSHSGDRMVIALGYGRVVGVDLERVKVQRDHEAIATRFFSPEEVTRWLALDPAERTPAFYRIWTRKEAYIKAVGTGLHTPLASFCVTQSPGSARLIRSERGDAERWVLAPLRAHEGYEACLCYEGPETAVEFLGEDP
jgi:4'-phosphopantetheinyl transferase